MIQTSGNQLIVDAFKLKQVISASWLGLFASSILALVLGYVQSQVVNLQSVLLWLAAVGLITILRICWLYMVSKHINQYTYHEVANRLSQFRLMMLVAGLVWGAAGYFLFTSNHAQYQVFLLLMLAGMSAGGIVSYAADLLSAALYSFGVLFPILISLILMDNQFSVWLPIAVTFYIGVMVQGLRRTNHEVINNFLLRVDANIKNSSIKAGEDRYHLLLQYLPIGVFHLNSQQEIAFCNQQLSQILPDTAGLHKGDKISQLTDQALLASIMQAIKDGETSCYEGLVRQEPEQWVSLIYAPMKNPHGEVSGGIGILQDITDRKQSADVVAQLALQDYLTDLPNRRALIKRLQHAIDQYTHTKRDIALLYIDLDHFKQLNDTLGHAVGDLLLQKVSKRLVQSLRQRDMIARAARIGGDEFIVVLEDLSQHAEEALNQAMLVANKITKKIHEPIKLKQDNYQCSVSIGVALYSASMGSVDDLLKHADIAMYKAKNARGTIEVFNQEMLDIISTKEDIRRALNKAIKNEEFELYYQPQVNAKKQVIGAEALIRWNRPKVGMVPPNEFIPIAEETGLIVDIGFWVLNQACIQLKKWSQLKDKKNWSISINVSAIQFLNKDFASIVEKTIKLHHVNPALLNIEVTESMFLDNTLGVINTMQALQKTGVGFELDDFGTGYSCLQYLKQLPLRQLKIDRSFVDEIDSDKNDQSIVKTIIAMAEGFSINVIAEGVETNSQFGFLKQYGCQHFQGYYFGKPLPIQAFEAFNT